MHTMQTMTPATGKVIAYSLSNRRSHAGLVFCSQEFIAPPSLPPPPFFLSLLTVSHRLFPSSQHRAGTPSRIPVTSALVSGAVNQVFLWIGASFAQSGFHRVWQRRPGNQQVHRQVCRADDKACWRTAAAASRSFKLFMRAVMPRGGLGTACSIFLRQTKLLDLKF